MIEGKHADIPADSEIIGVVLPGGARAYAVSSMSIISNHVINDVIEGEPLSITYCDQTDLARVFTIGDSSEHIDLSVAGRLDGKMLVKHKGKIYVQDASDIPLEDLQFTRTNWQTWRHEHPDTLVFIGA